MYEDQFDRPPEQKIARPLRAILFNTVTTDGEDLFVTIDSLDGGLHKWGPCIGWQPRLKVDGTHQMPYRGAEAIVQFDTDHDIWMLEWWPYA